MCVSSCLIISNQLRELDWSYWVVVALVVVVVLTLVAVVAVVVVVITVVAVVTVAVVGGVEVEYMSFDLSVCVCACTSIRQRCGESANALPATYSRFASAPSRSPQARAPQAALAPDAQAW
jgi:hypothetical protein